jgi:acetolactate synthase-1/2/3 large subunit
MPRWEAEQLHGARLSSDAFSELDAPDAVQPADVVRSARRLSPADSLATVDAGSHMFPATLFWTTSEPRRFLISNGLATMGYSLPAAIGAALSLGKAPTICFTGDGGLSMCVSELETAARTNARIVVVVFNDQSLSLIKTKQERREEPTAGLDFGAIDWAGAASAMGVPGVRVSSLAQFDEAFRKALAHDGPSLIDVQTDPRSYATMLQTIRG